MLTSKERAELRAKANPLETTLIIVGKGAALRRRSSPRRTTSSPHGNW